VVVSPGGINGDLPMMQTLGADTAIHGIGPYLI
jgi:hypothetical protein